MGKALKSLRRKPPKTAGNLVIGAAILALAGCTQTQYLSDFCLHAEPIRPNGAAWDAADDTFKRQIVAMNAKGAELCGWEP